MHSFFSYSWKWILVIVVDQKPIYIRPLYLISKKISYLFCYYIFLEEKKIFFLEKKEISAHQFCCEGPQNMKRALVSWIQLKRRARMADSRARIWNKELLRVPANIWAHAFLLFFIFTQILASLWIYLWKFPWCHSGIFSTY